MKQLVPNPNADFNVEILNNDETDIYKVLGISEERSDEIAEIAKLAYQSEEYFTDTIKLALSKMEHINEVVFMMLCLSKIHHKPKDDISAKLDMLKLLMQLKQSK